MFDPMVIRFYFLKQHYRNPLDFSLTDLQATEKAYKKIVHFFSDVTVDKNVSIKDMQNNAIVQNIVACLYDDLNTSGALGILFETMPLLHDKDSKKVVKSFLNNFLGLTLDILPEKVVQITPEIKALIDLRLQARELKNWKLADEIRDKLINLGVELKDEKLK